jgi:hypothetical protein
MQLDRQVFSWADMEEPGAGTQAWKQFSFTFYICINQVSPTSMIIINKGKGAMV